ncbi:MAG: DUF4147 domain-containing protein [archaeon]|nr:MAG: DUF4147 domain-containing protein [archaeon]
MPDVSKTKRNVLSIIDYALKESSVQKIFRSSVRLRGNTLKIKNSSYNLKNYDKIYVLGSGKASYGMALSLKKVLGKRISNGLIIYTKKEKNIGRIRVEKGTHPLPSNQSLYSTKKLLRLARKTTVRDLTIYLLSGGTSTMLCHPTISMKKFVELNRGLILSKRNIKQINRIRTRFSRVKGGRLLNHIQGKVVNLVISDVVGDSLEYIGSGPLYTKNKKNKVDSFIIANNRTLLKKAAEKAVKLGYRTKVVYPEYEGSPSALARKFRTLSKSLSPGTCIISGGELDMEVKGRGKGGPNQNFVLRCNRTKATLASIDSDGIDGKSKAAGAIADESDFTGKEKQIQKYLKNSDSYSFFQKTGGSIITGPTGNNLNDLRVMIKN